MWPRCFATEGDRPPGSCGKGERFAKEGVEDMKRSTGTLVRDQWGSSCRRTGAPLCVERRHNPGMLLMGPCVHGRGRTAVCCNIPILIGIAYYDKILEAFSRTSKLPEEGLEGLCWEGRRAGVTLIASSLSRVLAAP